MKEAATGQVPTCHPVGMRRCVTRGMLMSMAIRDSIRYIRQTLISRALAYVLRFLFD